MMSDEALLLVGLGNPGPEYASTRHNAGFMLMDLLCESCGCTMTQSEFQGIFGTARIGGRSVYLLKPQTFMNLSGRSVVACMNFYHLPIGQVLVIHDELDLPVGDLRVKFDGGSGGHNGLKSIIELTGSQGFGRVRVGIGRPQHGDVVNYVLGNLPQDDIESFNACLKIGVDAVKTYIARGCEASMRFCNGLYKAKKKEEAIRNGQSE